MTRMTGGCMCGKIRFEINAAPEFSFICACSECRKITGCGHAPQFAVAADAVRLSGELTFYHRHADSGSRVSNGFCATCGNPILKKTETYPDKLYFHVGALDAPEMFQPTKVVFGDSAQPWDVLKKAEGLD